MILGNCIAEKDIITTNQIISNIKQNLRKIRKRKYDKVIFLTYDIHLQRRLELLKGFLLLTGAKEKYIIDTFGNIIKVSLFEFLIKDIPKLILESLLSSVLIVYIYLKMLVILTLKDKNKKEISNPIRKITYLRTDHFFGTNKAGGSVGHIAGVANAFHELGYDVFFVSTDKLELIDEEKIPIYLIRPSYNFFGNFPEVPEMAYNLKLIKHASKIFQLEKPDLIYQRYSLNNYAGIILSRKFNIPFIIEYNGSFVWMGKHWGKPLIFEKVAETIEMANLHAADLVVVVSEAMRKELVERGIDERKILVNPNGVDPEKYSPDIDGSAVRKEYDLADKIVVGFIGTFGPWHGAEVLAEAVKYVVGRNRDVHFLFIGDGLTMPKVKKIIKRDKVEAFVTFTGLIPQEEAPNYLAACDIFVSPHVPNPDGTPFFGSPTKLFEYMAMGKGIVASNLDQIGKVLKHNYSAILVEPGNVEQLANGILKLAENEELREFLGRNAREEVVANYTWKQHVEKILNKLDSLTRKKL